MGAPQPRTGGKAGYGFGSSMRKTASDISLMSPGPGQYAHSPRMGIDGPKFSAQPRRTGIKSAEAPGPGQYGTMQGNPPSSPNGTKGYGFGTSPREGLHRRSATAPGPGAYNSHEHSGNKKGASYSMSAR